MSKIIQLYKILVASQLIIKTKQNNTVINGVETPLKINLLLTNQQMNGKVHKK